VGSGVTCHLGSLDRRGVGWLPGGVAGSGIAWRKCWSGRISCTGGVAGGGRVFCSHSTGRITWSARCWGVLHSHSAWGVTRCVGGVIGRNGVGWGVVGRNRMGRRIVWRAWMSRSVTGGVLGSKIWIWSRICRISTRSGSIVEWGSGARVEGSVHMGQGAGGVAWSYFAIEGRETWVVAVGRDSKTVGRRVGGNVGGLEGFGEDLERSLESFALMGGQGYNLGSTEPNFMQKIIRKIFRLQLDVFEVVENFLCQFLLLFVG